MGDHFRMTSDSASRTSQRCSYGRAYLRSPNSEEHGLPAGNGKANRVSAPSSITRSHFTI